MCAKKKVEKLIINAENICNCVFMYLRAEVKPNVNGFSMSTQT